MLCNYHNSQAVVSCSRCGKGLCSQCASLFEPPTCVDCVKEEASKTKTQMILNIVISVVLMVIGIVILQSIWGFLLAGIPSGWKFLNKITPNMFLWMPLVGWLIYFLIKLVLSYFIGLIAFPVQLIRDIRILQNANKLKSATQSLTL